MSVKTFGSLLRGLAGSGLILIAILLLTIPVQGGTKKIMLENGFVRYVIDSEGRSVSFVDKKTGRDYCARQPQAFVSIRKGGKSYEPSVCSFDRNKISVEFAQAGVKIAVRAVGAYGIYRLGNTQKTAREPIAYKVICGSEMLPFLQVTNIATSIRRLPR